MSDGQVPLQKAIVAAIKASTDERLKPLAGQIYDAVPEEATFPYASFGPFDSDADTGACNIGEEIETHIDTWSRAVGSVEAKSIGGALRALLTSGAVQPEGYRVTLVRPLPLRTQRGLDGKTTQTILKLRWALTPVA